MDYAGSFRHPSITTRGDSQADRKTRCSLRSQRAHLINFRQGPAMNSYFLERNQGIIMDCSDHYDAAEYSYELPPETPLLNDNAGLIFKCRIPDTVHAVDTQGHISEAHVRVYGDKGPVC